MDGIRKYSKEWFAMNGKDNKVGNVSGLKHGAENKAPQQSKTLNASIFLGSKEEVQANYDKLIESDKGRRPSDTQTNIKRYGLDNIFQALDADSDGKITQEEINDVAALSTGEFADKDDTTLSTDDLNILYQNAIDAANATFVDMGLTKEFHYENGDSTKITLNNQGKISNKTETSYDENGNKTSVSYDYSGKTRTDIQYDEANRITNYKYDSPDNKKDYTITNTYGNDGTKTVKRTDYISNTTKVYGTDGKLKSEDIKYNYESDGKIGDTKQQSIGDCWLLSGVNALNQSPEGQKILNDSIKHNNDGSITVTLKGVGKEYTYSPEEIIDNQYQTSTKHYSKGDTDMNLFEKAIGDYRQELIESGDYTPNGRNLDKTAGDDATPQDPLNGGQIDEAIYYITGLKSEYASVSKGNVDNANEMLNTYNTNHNKYIMTVSFQNDDPSITSGKIIDEHAYNISKVDNDYVYVMNPHDSSKEIAYPREEFLANVNQIALTDLTPNIKEQYISAPKEGYTYTAPKESFGSKVSKFFNKIFR